MYLYFFHGISICSEISLGLPEQDKSNPTGCDPESLHKLYITVTDDTPNPLTHLVWEDPFKLPDGRPHAKLYLKSTEPVFDVPDVGTFTLRGKHILFCPTVNNPLPAPYLLGRVFALWLELVGYPVLHGCCANIEGSAIGILAPSGMGKSTMGAAMVHAGIPLLTDDLIPLTSKGDEVFILPGIPMSRLWPETAKRFVPDWQSQRRVHPDSEKRMVFGNGRGGSRYDDTARPLRHLFILERQLEDYESIDIVTLSPAESLIALVQQSYRPDLLESLGIQTSRIALLGKALKTVAVHKLRYPTGYQQLSNVLAQIKAM